MTSVSRFEADLLRILQAVLGRVPAEGVRGLITARCPRPKCLSRGAVHLVQEALAKGCVWRLAREGGWIVDRHIRGDCVASGRLWERTSPEDLGLRFSGSTLEFLIWLTAEHPADRPARWKLKLHDLSISDRLVLFYGYEVLRAGAGPSRPVDLPQFARHALCRLAFTEDFSGATSPITPDFSSWVEGLGACVLEALQPYLAERWITSEREKLLISEPSRVTALGRAQAAILKGFLDAVERTGRWDLARFLLLAAATTLRDEQWLRPRAWASSLKELRVADRAEVYRAALAFPHCLVRLREWDRQARGVGYFDEGYAAGQLWKADWEAHGGDALCEQAAAIVRTLDPLGSGALVGT
jgi:hypothetical protein